jgi:acyl-coenzyme A thioesterase PaaI-like protein
MNPAANEFIKLMKHPVKFRMFLFFKLPSAFFSGVRLRDIDEKKCVVTVPYKWFSQNPFKSTYFACLAMAAEMSTGTLGLMQLHKRKPAVSMLVVKLEADYYKKAVGRTTFTCADGEKLQQAVDESIATGESRTVVAKSTGTNDKGELIAEFFVTWSFKAK